MASNLLAALQGALTGKNATEQPTTLAIASTVAAALVLIYFLFKALTDPKRGLPGPIWSFPVLGDSVELGLTNDTGRFVFNRFKKYGATFRLNMLGVSAFVVSDESVLRPLMAGEGAQFKIPFAAFTALMGSYETQSRKEVHGPWRKVYLTAVGGRALPAMLPGVRRVMESHLTAWASEGRVDLFQAARNMGLDLALDVIADVRLSERVDRKWFRDTMFTYINGMWVLPFRYPGSPLSKALAAKAALMKALEPEVADMHQRMGRTAKEAGGSCARMVELLQAGPEPVTVKEATLLAFFGLGHTDLSEAPMTMLHAVMAASDTTRFALFNTWTLLCQSPRVQEQLFQEQKKVVSEMGPELSYQALAASPLLEATFKECMRLLPASGGGIRRLTRDLHMGDKVIPEGQYLWYFPHLMHCLDPVLWDGRTDYDLPPHMDWRNNFEEAFKPERWLSEDTKPKHYYTFGSGAHLCSGVQLVTMEVKLMIALAVRRWRLELEVPDVLRRADRIFPFVLPAKGTDGMRLIPREDQLPW
ncbi:hypothetical protein HYH03_004188 [Edaphochlamys debaryana]|uniref:Cytochrome P450 n=1 Tax=Edaphochlamys debaryana TaxID=47281 RepID=A0A835Y8E3_9CHLO|nr:hypothetical protein HYH03_004188 [Edaphochlamys debaryana]|eukprot:KAG2497926.1 hypothetical protein HYH03_004188 [Edaphochlamys debaryana]